MVVKTFNKACGIIISLLLICSMFSYSFAGPVSEGGTYQNYNTPGGTCVNGVYNSGLLKNVPCDKPINSMDILLSISRNIIATFVLPAVGTIFLIVFIYGGIVYMSSAGRPEQVKKGKQILTTAIVGLLLIILAEVLIGIFVTALGGGIQ